MDNLLERRLRYFFSSRHRGRSDIHCTLAQLKAMGRLALIGGMLRDLALFGNAGFRSDLDFVIDAWDVATFEKHMLGMGAKMNRFGGYSLPSSKWQIDVWPLQKTWAHSAGYVTVRTFSDLRKATFFNCDAIVYDFSNKRAISSPEYFNHLSNRFLDVNLKPNPNPTGNAVRAFRYAVLKDFVWGSRLVTFVAETLDAVGWDALIEKEFLSFNTRYIEMLNRSEFERDLQHHMSIRGSVTFEPARHWKDVQLQLPYIH